MDDFDERLRLRLRALDAGVPAASANRRAGHGKLTPRRTLGPQVTGKLAFGLASGAEDRVARAKTEVIPSTWKSLRSMAGLALALCVALFVGIGYSNMAPKQRWFLGSNGHRFRPTHGVAFEPVRPDLCRYFARRAIQHGRVDDQSA